QNTFSPSHHPLLVAFSKNFFFTCAPPLPKSQLPYFSRCTSVEIRTIGLTNDASGWKFPDAT
ncbi:MAG TPA: hypothetical protein VKK06_10290, partial [Terriglobia bacterium]|nr:hypothetical protein [Terriglobia bacterium]